jgi:hypothetical protein
VRDGSLCLRHLSVGLACKVHVYMCTYRPCRQVCVCLNKFLFEGWTAKLTALRQAEIRMLLKVLISGRVYYEFVGQMSNIRGFGRAHDTSGLPLLMGGNLQC